MSNETTERINIVIRRGWDILYFLLASQVPGRYAAWILRRAAQASHNISQTIAEKGILSLTIMTFFTSIGKDDP